MRIEEIQPGTGKVQARTYLEIKSKWRLERFTRMEQENVV